MVWHCITKIQICNKHWLLLSVASKHITDRTGHTHATQYTPNDLCVWFKQHIFARKPYGHTIPFRCNMCNGIMVLLTIFTIVCWTQRTIYRRKASNSCAKDREKIYVVSQNDPSFMCILCFLHHHHHRSVRLNEILCVFVVIFVVDAVLFSGAPFHDIPSFAPTFLNVAAQRIAIVVVVVFFKYNLNMCIYWHCCNYCMVVLVVVVGIAVCCSSSIVIFAVLLLHRFCLFATMIENLLLKTTCWVCYDSGVLFFFFNF